MVQFFCDKKETFTVLLNINAMRIAYEEVKVEAIAVTQFALAII